MESVCKYCNRIFKKRVSVQVYCSLSCASRSNLNNKNFVKLPSKYSPDLAEFIGVLLGDGHTTKYYVQIFLNSIADADYVLYILSLSKQLFPGSSVTNRKRISEGVTMVQISAKDVSDYLLSIDFNPKIKYIPYWILQKEEYRRATVRGLFDTEGSIGFKYFKGKTGDYFYKQLTFTNKNKYILKFVEETLSLQGYNVTKNSNKNIYISNRLHIEKYFQEIGTNNPKLSRKNQIKEINGFRYGAYVKRNKILN